MRNWPPVWTLAATRNGSVRTLVGEVGVLKYAHSNSLMSNKCFLVIDFQEEAYIGRLIFNDHPFCGQISNLLRAYIGRPMKEVGDMDVSHLV
jgi:hypothetical protein